MLAPALLALVALTCARAEVRSHNEDARSFYHHRSIDTSGSVNVEGRGAGCLWGGRWWAEGAAVRPRDACLRCRCARAALSCARAACAPPPDPPPRRCALLHRRDACCPELHCPDGVRSLELEAATRSEDDSWDVETPAAPAHACTEDGAVFAAGSALASRAACERCFCLRGERRCVRPRCLPPPPGCTPRPAPGVCCPERYYCTEPQNVTTSVPLLSTTHRPHDCKINGEWVSEGKQVPAALAGADNCSQCFCLRGALRCQPAACTKALRGCTPLLRPGHCCPHQYHCPHISDSKSTVISDNALIFTRNEERSFRSSSTSKSTSKSHSTSTPRPSVAAQPATTKVKRKTNDSPPKPSNTTMPLTTVTTTVSSTTIVSTTAVTTEIPTSKLSPITTTLISTTDVTTIKQPLDQTSTEQPEGSVRVMVNGTINCTAELSSSLHNVTSDTEKVPDTEKILAESEARVPAVEMQTAASVDIITTDPFAGDSFIVNVSSSLFSNTSRPLPAPPAAVASPADIALTHNISKKTKEDFDYDYTEPSLPPSLPNLKIIPFVAADAVLEENEAPKETYPVLEREDKFPVYYPAPIPVVEHKKTPFATRREDVYHPTQYPVFVSRKQDERLEKIHVAKPTRPAPTSLSPNFTSLSTPTTPEINLFSPPAETEGGFIPKGPGPMAEYFAVYPSSPPPVPHLTTSMQINPDTSDNIECLTSDGRRVPEGESVLVGCAACACAWGELHCAPRRCLTPPHCRRRPATKAGADICCGELVCDNDDMTTTAPTLSTRRTEITLNVSKVPMEIQSEVIPFDPPPDSTPPELFTSTSTPAIHEVLETSSATNATLLKTPVEKPLDEKIKATDDSIDSQDHPPRTTPTPFTSKETATPPPPSSSTIPSTEGNDTISQEYEDEDEDEGFSFGSVLKLLLSDNYGSSTATTKKRLVIQTTTPIPTSSTPNLSLHLQTSRKPSVKPLGAISSFVPVQPHAYIPPKKVPPYNALNRIDHLVLGEATAIRKSTPRPSTTTLRPISTTKRYTTRLSTRKPAIATTRATTRVTKTEETTERYTLASSAEPARSQVVPGVGGGSSGGLLKLAGCNIYGRMYRVGRIITELSTPCQECRCTELGVQCTQLHC